MTDLSDLKTRLNIDATPTQAPSCGASHSDRMPSLCEHITDKIKEGGGEVHLGSPEGISLAEIQKKFEGRATLFLCGKNTLWVEPHSAIKEKQQQTAPSLALTLEEALKRRAQAHAPLIKSLSQKLNDKIVSSRTPQFDLVQGGVIPRLVQRHLIESFEHLGTLSFEEIPTDHQGGRQTHLEFHISEDLF